MRNISVMSDEEYNNRFTTLANLSKKSKNIKCEFNNGIFFILDDFEKQIERQRNIQKLQEEEKINIIAENWKKVQMNKLNTKVGLMFASKPVVQLIVNPFIGPLTNKFDTNT